MCMIDDCEQYEVWGHRTVKRSRKEHKCAECHRSIAVGESYEIYSCGPPVDGANGWDVYKVCSHCMVAVDWLTATCHGFVHTQVLEEMSEHATEYRRMDLYRMEVGMRKKWTGKHGQLLRVMKKLPAIRISH